MDDAGADCYLKDIPLEGRVYLDVKYKEKEAAKGLGAMWDKSNKSWFVPPALAHHLHRFAGFLPQHTERRRASLREHISAHPDRIYLNTSKRDARAAARGALWDAQCPPYGAYYVPPALTQNLRAFAQWLPEAVQVGGAAAAESDNDVSKVVMPGGGMQLPPHTMQWCFFWGPHASCIRRARDWTLSADGEGIAELLSQQEYNRRVEDPMWPHYKPDEELPIDARPLWHGGQGRIIPNVVLKTQRRNASAVIDERFWKVPEVYYKPDAKHVGRDVDEVVHAPIVGNGAGEGFRKDLKRTRAGKGAGAMASKQRIQAKRCR